MSLAHTFLTPLFEISTYLVSYYSVSRVSFESMSQVSSRQIDSSRQLYVQS